MAGKIETRQDSDGLVFYEGVGVSRTTSGHPLLKISPTEIKIGSTGSDVDFKVLLGSEEIYALFDAGSSALTIAGVDVSITGDITIDTEDIALGDGDSLEFGDGTDISFTFTDGTALAMEANVEAENFLIGDDTNNINVTLKGTFTVGKSGTGHDVKFWGNTAGSDFVWDENGDTHGSLILGASGTGVEFKVYGGLSGNYVHWDRSASALLLVGTSTTVQIAGTLTATTTTTGSLRTAGGLGVVENAYIGGVLNVAGAATVTGGVVIGTCTTGISIPSASNLTTGISILDTTITDAISIGVQNTGDLIRTSARPRSVEIFSTIAASEDITLTLRGLWSRFSVADGVQIGSSGGWGEGVDAIEGNVKLYGGTATNIYCWQIAGVWAMLECEEGDTINFQTGVHAAALFAHIELGTGSDLKTGSAAAAVIAFSNSHASATTTGTYDGFLVDKQSGKLDFDAGLRITDAVADIGVYVGTCDTVGISNASAKGYLTNATLVPDSSRTNYALSIGNRAQELTINLANDTSQNVEPFQMNINFTATGGAPTSTSTARLLRIRSTHDTTDMANLRIMNINTYMDVRKHIGNAYGQMNGVDFQTNSVTVGGEAAVGAFNVDAVSAVTGDVRGIIVNMHGSGLPSTTSIGLEVRTDGGSATLAEGIRIWSVAANSISRGIDFRGTVTRGLDFANLIFVPDSTYTNAALAVGWKGDSNERGVIFANTTNQNLNIIQMNINCTALDAGSGPTNSSQMNLIHSLITHDTHDMTNLRLKCGDWNIVAGKNFKDAYVLQTELDIVGNVTIGGEAFALSAYLNAGTGTYSVNDRLAAFFAIVSGTATVTGTYNVAHFFASANATVDNILQLETFSTASVTSGMEMYLDGAVTYAMDFQGTVSDAWTTADEQANELGAYNEYVKIPVRVAGVTPTLYLMAAETWQSVD